MSDQPTPKLTYLDPRDVERVIETEAPINRSRSGYGSKIPTPYVLQIGVTKYRVYCIQWSNQGTLYILRRGVVTYIDWHIGDLQLAKQHAQIADEKRLRLEREKSIAIAE